MVFNGYRTTSQYGWRIHPISGINKFHGGIDLVKQHKAPIKAFVPGKVVYAGLGKSGSGVGGYGNVVVIQDNKNKAHVYAHLDSVSVKKGQSVTTETTIGRQGATGQVTGSHLHYEVRKKASPSLGWTSKQENSTKNPTNYVKNYKGGGRVVTKLAVDGSEGKATVRRLQQFLGVKVDGDKGPITVKALQTFLNKYGQ